MYIYIHIYIYLYIYICTYTTYISDTCHETHWAIKVKAMQGGRTGLNTVLKPAQLNENALRMICKTQHNELRSPRTLHHAIFKRGREKEREREAGVGMCVHT